MEIIELKNKNILVTGGTGFIGSHIIKKLLEKNNYIRTISHKRKDSLKHKNLEIVKGNLCDNKFCKKIVEDIDIVFNCAAFSSGSFEIVNKPSSFVIPNLLIYSQMLEASAFSKVKNFIFMSSSTVYPESKLRQKEGDVWKDDIPKCYEAIGWLNRYLEKLAQFYHNNFDINISIIRASSIYGPGDNFNLKTAHVLPALIKKVVLDYDPIEIWGNGNNIRDFIYIDDLVKGIFLALKYYSCGRPINIAYGKSYRVKECLKNIILLTNKNPKVIYNINKPSTLSEIYIDIGLAKEKIKFYPEYDLKKGLKETIDWYEKMKGTL